METGSSSSGWAFLILCSNPRGLGVGGGGTLLLLESCGPSVTINASASKQGLLWRPGSSPPPCSASLLHGTRTLTQPASSRQPHPGLTTSPPPHGAPPPADAEAAGPFLSLRPDSVTTALCCPSSLLGPCSCHVVSVAQTPPQPGSSPWPL